MHKVETITIRTSRREQLVDITDEIRGYLSKSGVKDGIIVVFNPHTTGAVTINEGADPDVAVDIVEILKTQYPQSGSYRHLEGNSDAHIKSAIIGSDRSIIISGGKLVLGTWQKVFFCEFDGPRTRKIYLKAISS